MPQPADESLQTAITSDGGQTAIEVTSRDPAPAGGRPRDFLDTQANIVGLDFVWQTVTLAQVAPGCYRGEVAASRPGTYLVQVTQRDATGNPLAGTTAGLADAAADHGAAFPTGCGCAAIASHPRRHGADDRVGALALASAHGHHQITATSVGGTVRCPRPRGPRPGAQHEISANAILCHHTAD
jgi:hypothetical protein